MLPAILAAAKESTPIMIALDWELPANNESFELVGFAKIMARDATNVPMFKPSFVATYISIGLPKLSSEVFVPELNGKETAT